jgi:hypothetical protein
LLYAIVSIGYITAILRNLGFSYISLKNKTKIIFAMKNKLQKVLSILVVILFPFVLLKLPNEAIASEVLDPIFFLVLSIYLVMNLYDSFKKKNK